MHGSVYEPPGLADSVLGRGTLTFDFIYSLVCFLFNGYTFVIQKSKEMKAAYISMLPIYCRLGVHRKVHEGWDQRSILGPYFTFCICIFMCNFSRFPQLCLPFSPSTPNLLKSVSHKILNFPAWSLDPPLLPQEGPWAPEDRLAAHPRLVSFELLFPIFPSFPIVKPSLRSDFQSLTSQTERSAPP